MVVVKQTLLHGLFRVPESSHPRGRTIDLNVAVLPALDPRQIEAPLFELPGRVVSILTARLRTWLDARRTRYTRML